MKRASALPAAIFVAALPLSATAQSTHAKRPVYVFPPAPPAPPVIFVPPAPPMPPVPMPAYVTQPKPIGDPSTWFTDDDYPAAAKRAGQQGRVGIALMVNATGRPVTCSVTQSSGSESLDLTTCRLAVRRGRFAPPLNVAGNPVEFIYPLTARWELRDSDDLDFDLNDARVDIAKGSWSKTLFAAVIDVDKEGLGVACGSGTPGISDAIACDDFYVGRKMMDPVFSAGKPVPVRITVTRSIRVQPLARRP